jgi:hypothetical protein
MRPDGGQAHGELRTFADFAGNAGGAAMGLNDSPDEA